MVSGRGKGKCIQRQVSLEVSIAPLAHTKPGELMNRMRTLSAIVAVSSAFPLCPPPPTTTFGGSAGIIEIF